MPIPQDWSERIEHLIRNWENRRGAAPMIHRVNFEKFIVVDTVTSWENFELLLKEFDEGDWIFRGHANAEWRLETSLERATLKSLRPTAEGAESLKVRLNQQVSEGALLFDFQRRAHHYIAHTPADDEVVDWLALMQHYGAPTRLLDWTRSPYVALYFALERAVPAVRCAVWAIESRWLNEHAEEIIRQADSEYPKGEDLRARYRYLNRVLLRDTNSKAILSTNPIRMNERMAAQQGLFLCNLNSIDDFDLSLLRMIVDSKPPHRPVVRKLVLATDYRIAFLRQLTRMNITSASLFPGLDGFARSLGVNLEINLESSRRSAEELLSSMIVMQDQSGKVAWPSGPLRIGNFTFNPQN